MALSISKTRRTGTETAPGCGAVVLPASDLAGIQTRDGELLPPERLGPGLVEAVGPDDLCVHWLDVDLTAWVGRDDVQPLSTRTRLVSVWYCDLYGRCTLRRRCMVELDHHWRVDLLPTGVIRAIRPDGSCWTFTFNSLRREVDAPWHEPLTDDGAEAIVAADAAMEQPNMPLRAIRQWLALHRHPLL